MAPGDVVRLGCIFCACERHAFPRTGNDSLVSFGTSDWQGSICDSWLFIFFVDISFVTVFVIFWFVWKICTQTNRGVENQTFLAYAQQQHSMTKERNRGNSYSETWNHEFSALWIWVQRGRTIKIAVQLKGKSIVTKKNEWYTDILLKSVWIWLWATHPATATGLSCRDGDSFGRCTAKFGRWYISATRFKNLW